MAIFSKKFVVLALLISSTFAHGAPEFSAALADVSGDVKVNGKPVQSGSKIQLGSEITTGGDGKLQVLIGEGMVAVIGFGSTVRLEKYQKSVVGTKLTKLNQETAQLELRKGSMRYLVSEKEGLLRMATIRSGDAFGVVKGGEAHFECNEACSEKILEETKAPKKAGAKKKV